MWQFNNLHEIIQSIEYIAFFVHYRARRRATTKAGRPYKFSCSLFTVSCESFKLFRAVTNHTEFRRQGINKSRKTET